MFFTPSRDWRHLLASLREEAWKTFILGKIPGRLASGTCQAPHAPLYYHDRKKRTQLLREVCGQFFQQEKRFRQGNTKYYYPYCQHALITWKQRKESPSINTAMRPVSIFAYPILSCLSSRASIIPPHISFPTFDRTFDNILISILVGDRGNMQIDEDSLSNPPRAICDVLLFPKKGGPNVEFLSPNASSGITNTR
jgi:hypothetical protein